MAQLDYMRVALNRCRVYLTEREASATRLVMWITSVRVHSSQGVMASGQDGSLACHVQALITNMERRLEVVVRDEMFGARR